MTNEQILDHTKPIAEQIEEFVNQDVAKVNVSDAKMYLNEALSYQRKIDRVRKKLAACETQVASWVESVKAEINAGGNGSDAYNAQRGKVSDVFYKALDV